MSWGNLHTHTKYSDGTHDPEVYVLKAIEEGLDYLGFSDHAPFVYPTEWAMKIEDIDKYALEIDALKLKYKDQIDLFLGLEIDYISGIMGPSSFRSPLLDYSIGSVHFIGQLEDGSFMPVDYTKELYQKGLVELYDNNVQKLVTAYYENIKEMLRKDPPDVLGHMDLIKMHTWGEYSEHAAWYKDLVMDVITLAHKQGVVIEINTRGVLRGKTDEFYPARWIMDEIAILGVPVMLNSDAHQPEELTTLHQKAIHVMESAGIKQMVTFSKNKWKTIAL